MKMTQGLDAIDFSTLQVHFNPPFDPSIMAIHVNTVKQYLADDMTVLEVYALIPDLQFTNIKGLASCEHCCPRGCNLSPSRSGKFNQDNIMTPYLLSLQCTDCSRILCFKTATTPSNPPWSSQC